MIREFVHIKRWTYWTTCLLHCRHVFLPSCLSIHFLLACLPICLLFCLPACLPLCVPAYLLDYHPRYAATLLTWLPTLVMDFSRLFFPPHAVAKLYRSTLTHRDPRSLPLSTLSSSSHTLVPLPYPLTTHYTPLPPPQHQRIPFHLYTLNPPPALLLLPGAYLNCAVPVPCMYSGS